MGMAANDRLERIRERYARGRDVVVGSAEAVAQLAMGTISPAMPMEMREVMAYSLSDGLFLMAAYDAAQMRIETLRMEVTRLNMELEQLKCRRVEQPVQISVNVGGCSGCKHNKRVRVKAGKLLK